MMDNKREARYTRDYDKFDASNCCPENLIEKHMVHMMESNNGDSMTCVHCGSVYHRGVWDFYGLCAPCFSAFHDLKMEGRLNKGPRCEDPYLGRVLIERRKASSI